MIFLTVPILAVTGFLIHFFISGEKRTGKRAVELLLLYLIVFCVGLSCLYAFVGHVFFADDTARSIGWSSASPFQYEVGVANLAFGVLGILCIRFRGNFWVATIIGVSVFLFGAAVGHFREAVEKGNFSPNNFGPVLWVSDITMPLIMIGLLIVLHVMDARSQRGLS